MPGHPVCFCLGGDLVHGTGAVYCMHQGSVRLGFWGHQERDNEKAVGLAIQTTAMSRILYPLGLGSTRSKAHDVLRTTHWRAIIRLTWETWGEVTKLSSWQCRSVASKPVLICSALQYVAILHCIVSLLQFFLIVLLLYIFWCCVWGIRLQLGLNNDAIWLDISYTEA